MKATSTFVEPVPCPACGAPALRSAYCDGAVSCPSCDRVLEADEFDEAFAESARRWWRSLDDFTRGVLHESRATLAIKRLAVRLLDAGVEPEIVEQLASIVNSQLPRPALRGDLDAALIESARIVGRRRRRAA